MPRKVVPTKKDSEFVYDEEGNKYRIDEDFEEEQVSVKPKVKKNNKRKNSTSKGKKSKKSKKSESDSTSSGEEIEAAVEPLSVEEMQAKADKEEEKKYHQCKRFVKQYEKKMAKKKWEALPEWKKASELLKNAASILARYKTLLVADLTSQKYLPEAVEPLRAKGESQFQEAQTYIAKLSAEDSAKLWEEQIRNKDAKRFEDLITKTKWDQMLKEKAVPEVKLEDAPQVTSEVKTESVQVNTEAPVEPMQV